PAAPAIRAGRNTADAADVEFAPVPADGPEVNSDMTGKTARGRVNQHAQVGVGPFDLAPGQLLDDIGRPDRVEQRFYHRPRCVSVQNVDFDAHSTFNLSRAACFRSYVPHGRQVTDAGVKA